jgi:hypothetical protein
MERCRDNKVVIFVMWNQWHLRHRGRSAVRFIWSIPDGYHNARTDSHGIAAQSLQRNPKPRIRAPGVVWWIESIQRA